jgi:hypothetical protein
MLSPLYGQLSPLRVPTKVAPAGDPDVLAYIAAVEAADGQALEEGVATAFTDFILGCKSDGIWTALKASCILAGARTLSGALVPLVGTAPTNFNFVSADYNRETGLKGNGTTKYLNSNRAGNDDPQDNAHLSVYTTQRDGGASNNLLGYYKSTSPAQLSIVYTNNINTNAIFYPRLQSATGPSIYSGNTVPELLGVNRSSSTQINAVWAATSATYSYNSLSPVALNHYLFAYNQNGTSAQSFAKNRLSFYSIGESIDLSLLRTRVSTLMTDLAAAIP